MVASTLPVDNLIRVLEQADVTVLAVSEREYEIMKFLRLCLARLPVSHRKAVKLFTLRCASGCLDSLLLRFIITGNHLFQHQASSEHQHQQEIKES